MTEIKQTSKGGIPLIGKLALEAFPATYAKISRLTNKPNTWSR